MKYIEITNKGEIDINAFVLLGASTKREDESKIGFFGSGLKYAIATLMRNNIPFLVYSGKEEIILKRRKETLKGMKFESITIAGRRTSLTTAMGPDWQLWQAIREVYCNALDEENYAINIVEAIYPEKDVTKFYIQITEKINEILNDWNSYFSDKRTDIVVNNKDCKIFTSKDKMCIYRKGIRCYDDNIQESLYDYDFDSIVINESRVIKWNWDLREKPAQIWGRYATGNMIRNLFDNCKNNHLEKDLYWKSCTFYNNMWLDVINGRLLIPNSVSGYFISEQENRECLILPTTLINSLRKFFGDKIKVAGKSSDCGKYFVIESTPKQDYLLKETLLFFKEANMKIEYPIKIAIFEDKMILGTINNKEIILSTYVFDRGKKQIASTILEEVLHIESGMKDESRNFQDYIINKLLTLIENKQGVFL